MRKHLKSLGALAVASALFLPSPALAATENGEQPTYSETNKFVYANTHVDAPKVYWDAATGEFKLQTTYSVRNEDGERTQYVLPIDHALNYVSKGWRGRNPAHLYYVSDDPTVAPLGAPGTVLYAAPQIAGTRNTPIWAGFGADADIPIDKFRDREFSLNLIAVDGPGKVEYFMTGPSGDITRRLFSSHDTTYRETLMMPAQHSHNYTTFTKPGKYRMVFQAFARDTLGNPIVSRPQVHEWRVGGNDPRSSFTRDFRAAYAQAPAATQPRETQPSLQVMPKPESNYQVPGDEYYTDFIFNTGNPADTGFLVITIDGYELIQLPVENGRAQGSEMLGDEVANYQAIFIPAAGAPTAKWVSAQFSYQRKQSGVEQNLETTEIAPESSLNPAPVFPLRTFDISDEHVDLTITPLADRPGKYQVSIVARDPQFKGKVRGGFSSKENQTYYDCFLDADLTNGRYERVHDFEYCQNNFHLKLEINPFPSVNATGTNYAKQVTISNGFTETFTLSKTASPPSDAPKPGTTQPVSAGDTTPVTLTQGHIDIVAQPGSQVAAIIKDDTLQHSTKIRVERASEAVTMFVPRGALQTRTSEQGEARFDFLGAVGSHYYLLPEAQDHQLIWPGFSTEELDYDKYPAGIDFQITPKQIPAGGKAVGFSVDPFAEAAESVTTFFNTDEPGKHLLRTISPTHRHLNWVFTKPGVYELNVAVVSGGKPLGPTRVLKFVIDTAETENAGTAAPSGNGKPAQPTVPTQENSAINAPAGNNPTGTNPANAGAITQLLDPQSLPNPVPNRPQPAGPAAPRVTGFASLPPAAQPVAAPATVEKTDPAKSVTPGAAADKTTKAKSAESANGPQTVAVKSAPQPAGDPTPGVLNGLQARDWLAMGISLAGVLLLAAGLILIAKKSRKKA